MFGPSLSSVRQSVRPFVNVYSHMPAFKSICGTFLISNFELLISNFKLLCMCDVRVPPSVRLSQRVHIRASNCLIVHATVHQCMRSCVCMHACVRAYGLSRPSAALLSVCLSVRMHVRASKCFFVHAYIH